MDSTVTFGLTSSTFAFLSSSIMHKQSQQDHQYGEPILLVESLPKRPELGGVIVSVNRPPDGNAYAKTAYQWLVLKCRMLIFAESQILSSPVFHSETQLYIIASKQFICMGKLKELFDRHELSESASRRVEVTDSVMQACLRYTLIARLAPKWNQLGPSMLVQGRDFITESAPMSALKLTILVQGDQVVLNVWPLRLRLPHLQLCDLEVRSEVITQFISQHISFIPSSSVGNEWMRTLPGLKSGRVVIVSHQIPPTCPFLNYKDIRRHWKNMYGYRLPEEQPGSAFSPAGPYITISFKKWRDPRDVGYTYPALCVRAQNPIFLPNVDHAAVVRDFSTDLSECLSELCGLPFKPTLKIGQPLARLTTAQTRVLHDTANMGAAANLSTLSLSNLPSGRKPSSSSQTPENKGSQLFSQNALVHTQLLYQNRNESIRNPPTSSTAPQETNTKKELPTLLTSPSPNLQVPAIPKFTPQIPKLTPQVPNFTPQVPKFTPTFPNSKVKDATLPKPVSGIPSQSTVQVKEKELSKNVFQKPLPIFGTRSPPCGITAMTSREDVPTAPSFSAAESLGSAAEPSVSQENTRKNEELEPTLSKWSYPKSSMCREPLQDAAVSSGPRYVPVFGKAKPKTVMQKKTPAKQNPPSAVARPAQVAKSFQNPQAHLPLTKMSKTLQEDSFVAEPQLVEDCPQTSAPVSVCETLPQKTKPCFTKQNTNSVKKPRTKPSAPVKKVPKPKKQPTQKSLKTTLTPKIISSPICENITTPTMSTLQPSKLQTNLSQTISINSTIPEKTLSPYRPVNYQANENLNKIITSSQIPPSTITSNQNHTPENLLTTSLATNGSIKNVPVKQSSFSFSSSFISSKFASVPGGTFKSSFTPRCMQQNSSAQVPNFNPCLPQGSSTEATMANFTPHVPQNSSAPVSKSSSFLPQNSTYQSQTTNVSSHSVSQSYGSQVPNLSLSHSGVKRKNKDLSGTSSTPIVKKPRPSKPEPTSEEISQMARVGKLELVSMPVLVKWLKEQNVPCKARDKKATLMAKVLEKLGLPPLLVLS